LVNIILLSSLSFKKLIDLSQPFFFSFLFSFFKKVPVFDARETTEGGQIEFEKLDDIFLRFEGEVPVGSCVAVGHSVTSYVGKKDDEERLGTKIHLGTNVLFVIVFGTPPI
jgi:hypothetical protein